MTAIQLNFTLRTSSNCKTVHLIGSWDNYKGQYPLAKDPTKSGGWKGGFRFQGSQLKQGTRYWYYYMIDGYHVSHDPARESVVEPTTGRKLNILDIPSAKGPPDPGRDRTSKRLSTASGGGGGHSRRSSVQVPKGRSLSPSQIQSPFPTKPHATRHVVQERFMNPTVDALSAQLAATDLNDSEESDGESESDSGSDVPSLTNSRSSNNSSPSSVSSLSSCCTCERYGITRSGERVKLDCGGSRCGTPSDGSECSSESENEYRTRTTRRQGVMVRR